jgi:predicted TIM-barrel fold metal-dependent hydrolase
VILDCHMHSWRYPEDFNREVMLANQPERRRSWPDERFHAMWHLPIDAYLKEMEASPVDKALLLGLKAGDSFGVQVDNAYLAEVARSHPDKLVWGCCVNPTDPGAADEVARWVRDYGAVAVGELGPGYGGYDLDDPRCFPLYEAAIDLDIPLVIHAGPVQARFGRLKHTDLAAVDEIAIRFPSLRIVICHLGYPRYEEAAFLVAKHENVYADISWLPQIAGLDRRALSRYLPQVEFPYFHLAYPLLYYFTQTFGEPDKLLWGSDFPACSPGTSIQAVRDVNRILEKHGLPKIPEAAIERMLHENWRKVFTKVS